MHNYSTLKYCRAVPLTTFQMKLPVTNLEKIMSKTKYMNKGDGTYLMPSGKTCRMSQRVKLQNKGNQHHKS